MNLLTSYVDPETYKLLDWGVSYSGGFVSRSLRDTAFSMLPTLPLAVILIAVAFYPVFKTIAVSEWASKKTFYLWISFALATSLPLFVVAIDWGRFLYINAVCLGIVCLALLSRRNLAKIEAPTWYSNSWVILAYMSTWSLGFLGELVRGSIPLEIAARVLYRLF